MKIFKRQKKGHHRYFSNQKQRHGAVEGTFRVDNKKWRMMREVLILYISLKKNHTNQGIKMTHFYLLWFLWLNVRHSDCALSSGQTKLKSRCQLAPSFHPERSVLVTKLCLSLCHPMDCSLPGSSVHRIILKAKILEWVAIPFFSGSSQPKDQTQVSCIIGRLLTV